MMYNEVDVTNSFKEAMGRRPPYLSAVALNWQAEHQKEMMRKAEDTVAVFKKDELPDIKDEVLYLRNCLKELRDQIRELKDIIEDKAVIFESCEEIYAEEWRET